jgi:hypothetical protein
MMHPVDRPAPLRAISRQIAIWLPIGVMLWSITVRGGIVDGYFSRALTDCGGCLRPVAFKHDLPLLALVVLLQLAGATVRSHALSVALRLCVCGVLLVYFADMVIFDLFAHRLNLLDLAGYGLEFRAIKSIFMDYIRRPQSVAVAVALIACSPAWRSRSRGCARCVRPAPGSWWR